MTKKQKSKSPLRRDPIAAGLHLVGTVVVYRLAELAMNQQEHCYIFNNKHHE